MSTLTISEAIDHLGASHVAAIVTSGRAYFGISHRDSFAGRAHGQWLANQLDNYLAYGRLERQADWCEVIGVLFERGYDALGELVCECCDACGYPDDGTQSYCENCGDALIDPKYIRDDIKPPDHA